MCMAKSSESKPFLLGSSEQPGSLYIHSPKALIEALVKEPTETILYKHVGISFDIYT